MTVKTVTPQNVLEHILAFSLSEQRWLAKQLINRLLGDQPQMESTSWKDDEPLPESATVDEAIDLFLADKCSLGRAAELASVTRWDIQGTLQERGIPIYGGSEITVEQMYDQIEWLEERGIL
ncbi:MAG: UPF0175 family protein [Ardenticatenaceae bacterium]